jgi:hypothetical protein
VREKNTLFRLHVGRDRREWNNLARRLNGDD